MLSIHVKNVIPGGFSAHSQVLIVGREKGDAPFSAYSAGDSFKSKRYSLVLKTLFSIMEFITSSFDRLKICRFVRILQTDLFAGFEGIANQNFGPTEWKVQMVFCNS